MIAPSAVFGTWKAAVRTVDKTRNPNVVTMTPDGDPAKNNYNFGAGSDPVPTGLENQVYGGEVRWDLSTLNLLTLGQLFTATRNCLSQPLRLALVGPRPGPVQRSAR